MPSMQEDQSLKAFAYALEAFDILHNQKTLKTPTRYKVLTSPIYNESKDCFFKVAFDPITGHTADLD